MKIPFKHLHLIQLGLAGLLVLISALLAADPARTSLGLWFGALWLALAWRYELSTLLMSLLVFMALRGEASMGLAESWFLSANLGLSAVTLSCFISRRWAAPLCALLWVAMMWVSPLLLVLVLAGFPRFGKTFAEQSKWFVYPGLILFSVLTGFMIYDGSFSLMLDRPFDDNTYAHLQSEFFALFSVESLWRIIPLIGIFSLAQKQPEEHRFTWRNLALFGAVVSLLFVPAAPAMQFLFLIGLPLSSIMLTRWFYGLPDLISRSLYCLGLTVMAFPFLQGGVS